MSMGPATRAIHNLPIREAVVATHRTLLDHRRDLLRATLIPMALTLLLMVLKSSAHSFLLRAILVFADSIPYTLFGVAWHRVVLLGPAGAPSVVPSWRKRHWRFLVYALAISIIVGALMALGSVVLVDTFGRRSFSLVMIVISYFGFYMTLRFCFVLPAVSVDESYRLADSWRQTKGQGWRMLLAWLIAVLPIWIVSYVAANLLPLKTSGSSNSLGLFFALVVAYLSIALTVTLVSISFRICSGWTPCSPRRLGSAASGPDQQNNGT